MKLNLFLKSIVWLKAKLRKEPLPPYFYNGPGRPNVNIYVDQIGAYKNWIYLEGEALKTKGHWSSIFENRNLPLDLEIGCGNGTFFEHMVKANPHRNFLGMELKYKPLVQTIRRVKRWNAPNGKGIRFNAKYLDHIFAPGEISNAFIFFPDPWPKTRHQKNRLVRKAFLNNLHGLQKSNGTLDFKTDSESYFDFVSDEIKGTPYSIERYTRDLHRSEWAKENFLTAFERIFMAKGQPIFYLRLRK